LINRSGNDQKFSNIDQGFGSPAPSNSNELNLSNDDLTGSGVRGDNRGYQPTITLTTKNLGNNIQIRIKDNGPGIPPNIIDKIFQPFFTTKPTGQGTGLGLSLAYDIIKAHNGELKVETTVGEGSEFIIQLPVV